MADQSLIVIGIGVSGTERADRVVTGLRSLKAAVVEGFRYIRSGWRRSGGMHSRQVAAGYRDELYMGSRGFLHQ